MKAINTLCVALSLLATFTACRTPLKNVKTESVKIYGNCNICKKTIEAAGYDKKDSRIEWNTDTKMAVLTYDSIHTNADAILKKIALAGYDSDKYLAPDEAYAMLAKCCQYERAAKVAAKETPADSIALAPGTLDTASIPASAPSNPSPANDKPITGKGSALPPEKNKDIPHTMPPAAVPPPSASPEKNTPPMPTPQIKNDPLPVLFDHYFLLKDALVKTDGSAAAIQAKALLHSIESVQMQDLTSPAHEVWMKVVKDLTALSRNIAENADIAKQRETFVNLSEKMHQLIAVTPHTDTIYFQHCPMYNDGKGANWLSREKEIRNPYYGDEMLTCGKVIETIK